MTHYPTRLLAFAGVFALFLGAIAEHAAAEGAKLRPLAPPEDALHRTPGPDGRVSMRLDLGEKTSSEPVIVTMRPFWGKGDTPFEFKLVGPGAAPDGKRAEIQVDQPLVLIAAGIPEDQVVWGVLTAEQGSVVIQDLGHIRMLVSQTCRFIPRQS